MADPYDCERGLILFADKQYETLYHYLLPYAQAGEPDAQCMLGSLYHLGLHVQLGLHVPMSRADTFHWYQRAAQQGHSVAWNNLGTLYLSGAEGVEPDIEKARQCYEKSRALGFEHACRLDE